MPSDANARALRNSHVGFERKDYTDPLGRQLPYLATIAEGCQEQLRDLSSDAQHWYVTGSQTVRAHDAGVALATDLVRGRDESFRAARAARFPAHHFDSQVQQLDQSSSKSVVRGVEGAPSLFAQSP
jgi:hypothetical protein